MNPFFTLSDNSLALMAEQLNFSGTFNHTCRSAYSRHQIQLKMKVEREVAQTAVTITMGGERHSLTLQTGQAGNGRTLADFVEAIANGRVDSAEPTPPRLHLAPAEPESALDTAQQMALGLLASKGGHQQFDVGLESPIHVMVHRTHSRPGITVIGSVGERKPRTFCWTAYGTHQEITARLQESVERLVLLATPKAA